MDAKEFNRKLNRFIKVCIKILVVLILWQFLGVSGMLVSQDVAVKALETQGFCNVHVIDKHWMFFGWHGGDKGVGVRFDVVATNPIGQKVSVYVFSGWLFKAATVRTR